MSLPKIWVEGEVLREGKKNIGLVSTKYKIKISERVTKIENIKTDATKILRPNGFSWSKNIKTDSFFVGLTL